MWGCPCIIWLKLWSTGSWVLSLKYYQSSLAPCNDPTRARRSYATLKKRCRAESARFRIIGPKYSLDDNSPASCLLGLISSSVVYFSQRFHRVAQNRVTLLQAGKKTRSFGSPRQSPLRARYPTHETTNCHATSLDRSKI